MKRDVLQRLSLKDPPLRLLSTREVAEILQIHVKSVPRLVAHHGLPCIRVGTKRRFDLGDLQRWLSARKEG